MTRQELINQIRQKQSYLCVGLDTVASKMPESYPRTVEGMLDFNRMLIDETAEYAVAYKPNLAFYEALGTAGWELLKETIAYIPDECLVIADAKRGDIGNTAEAYAKAMFDDLKADAVTIAPYMGKDAVQPFLEHSGKWTIVLGLTSNPGAADFQYHGEPPLYERVIRTCAEWGNPEQLMFVVGATRPQDMAGIRAMVPEHYFLVPGVGAQGGDLTSVSQSGFSSAAKDADPGLLVNSSRGIIYAGKGEDHRERIRAAAREIALDMSKLLRD